MVRAEAVFGSLARGDADHLSDRDILLVGDCSEYLIARKASLESKGWSVSSYTARKFKRMADAGSLFVQHIKSEAIILVDDNNFLKSILEGFKAKSDYSSQIKSSMELSILASNIINNWPSCVWSADLFYISLRNIVTARLAGAGVYIFSFERAMNEVFSGVSEEKIHKLTLSMRDMRRHKKGFGTVDRDFCIEKHFIEPANELLCGLGLEGEFKFADPEEMIERKVSTKNELYYRVKEVELIVNAHIAMGNAGAVDIYNKISTVLDCGYNGTSIGGKWNEITEIVRKVNELRKY